MFLRTYSNTKSTSSFFVADIRLKWKHSTTFPRECAAWRFSCLQSILSSARTLKPSTISRERVNES